MNWTAGEIRRRLARDLKALTRITYAAGTAVGRWARYFANSKVAVPLLWLVLIEFGLAAANHAGWHFAGGEIAADRFMRWHVGRVVDPTAVRSFAFIDIDQRSFLAWGEPDPLSRAKLVQLVQYAAAGGARQIILDIELSRPAPDQEALLRFIETYGSGDDSAAPPLILLRSFSASPSEKGIDVSYAMPVKLPNPKSEKIFWAHSLFSAGEDGVVRYWRLWQPSCTGASEGIPSVELLSVALLSGAVDQLRNELSHRAKSECEGRSAQAHTSLRLLNKSVDLESREVGERVMFSIGDQESSSILSEGISTPLVNRLSADTLTKAIDQGMATSGDRVRGRIVVIGSSHWEARDIHLTPIGLMSGPMILINSINTLVQFGQLRPLPPVLEMGLGLAIGLMVWACLEYLRFPIAFMVTGFLVTAIAASISWFTLREGIWVDAFLPSIGMFVHRWLVTAEDLWKHRKRGWRAILKDE